MARGHHRPGGATRWRGLFGPASFVLSVGVPAWAGIADEIAARRALEAGQEAPLVRIGLEPAAKVFVSSDAPYTLLDAETGDPVWKGRFSGETLLVAEGAPEGGSKTVYRIQVGAFSSREAAERAREAVERATGERGFVRFNPDRSAWRVRIGEASSREDLRGTIARARAAGYEGAWIVEEPAGEIRGVTIRIVDASYASAPTGRTRLLVVPSPDFPIRVGGKPYRGIVEVRVSPYGALRPINWVGLEAYLRGVVPAELGPEEWPSLEALKAQAVAARTYAWRHLGQFGEEGFDLCAQPRCQAYGGLSSEHPLSNEAVRATRGEILTYEGAPISALYTSTCGGHTEDASEVFPEEAAPYLSGVRCRTDAEEPGALRAVLRGAAPDPVLDEAGEDVARAAALLCAAGVLPREPTSRYLHGTLRAEELRSWTEALLKLAGLPPPGGVAGEVDRLGQAVARVLSDLGWSDHLNLLLADEDVDAIVRSERDQRLPATERRALAYVAWLGLLPRRPDGSFGASEPASRARILPLLARIGERYAAFGLQEGIFVGTGKGTIHVQVDKAERSLPLAPRPRLFARVEGRAAGVETLTLWPGDRIRFRRDGEGRVDFLELLGPLRGLADDRQSPAFSWEVRRTRAELEAAINRFVAVGTLEDLQVVRRGRSGRIVELRVVGSEGSAVVRGFDVRNLLGLRDTLAVFEIQRDPAGRISSAVFSGKGWGHGVGLCQTGAYGMALRGKTYREILSHYYPGTKLETIRPGGARAPGAGSETAGPRS